MLIGLGHKARVGKDTVGDILVAKHGFTKMSFAGALKDMAMRIDPVIFQPAAVNLASAHGRLKHLVQSEGWESAKRYPEVRRFLQELGVTLREQLGEDFWVDLLRSKLPEGACSAGGPNIVLTDVRFPSEVRMVKDLDAYEGLYQGHVVRIDRPNAPPIPGPSHESEIALDGFDGWDYVLVNDQSVKDLDRKVEDMLIDLARPESDA